MLEAVLRHLNNWFVVRCGIHAGTYSVVDGAISIPFLQNGQYFRVCGSVFNDGVYQYPPSGMTDEVFDGTVWALAIPESVISLAEEIGTWNERNGETGPYQSESFGGYNYTKASDTDGSSMTWQGAFRDRLSKWRKM